MANDAKPMPRSGKPTISGQVSEDLRTRIVAGNLEPGGKLNLDALRSEYSVSLSSLREAITRLAADGLIETEEQRGYRVAPISMENLDEVTQLRMELEPLALRRAIRNGGLDWETGVMASLYRLNHTERRPSDPASLAAWETAHNAFHDALIDRCDMPVLRKFHRILLNMNHRYRHIFQQLQVDQRDLAAEHAAIAEAATQRREEDAVSLLTAHIETTGRALREHLEIHLPESGP